MTASMKKIYFEFYQQKCTGKKHSESVKKLLYLLSSKEHHNEMMLLRKSIISIAPKGKVF